MTTDSDEPVSESDDRQLPRPLVIAHRGASGQFPENTLAAFAGAAALGADWVELDVRRCGDGVLVVHHDPVLADGRTIIDTPSAALPDAVPSLEAALRVCADHHLGVNIEIKADPGEPDFDEHFATAPDTVGVMARVGGGPFLVSSFHPYCLDAARECLDDLEDGPVRRAVTAQLVLDLPDRDRLLARTLRRGHGAINPGWWLVDEALVSACHAAGLRVYPWTVDEPEVLASFFALGVDGIVTNVPDVAVDVRG